MNKEESRYRRLGVGYFCPRLMVYQAREQFPQYPFARIGKGWVVHFITSEFPALIVFTLCGDIGFADDDIEAEDLTCLRCLAKAKGMTIKQ